MHVLRTQAFMRSTPSATAVHGKNAYFISKKPGQFFLVVIVFWQMMFFLMINIILYWDGSNLRSPTCTRRTPPTAIPTRPSSIACVAEVSKKHQGSGNHHLDVSQISRAIQNKIGFLLKSTTVEIWERITSSYTQFQNGIDESSWNCQLFNLQKHHPKRHSWIDPWTTVRVGFLDGF